MNGLPSFHAHTCLPPLSFTFQIHIIHQSIIIFLACYLLHEHNTKCLLVSYFCMEKTQYLLEQNPQRYWHDYSISIIYQQHSQCDLLQNDCVIQKNRKCNQALTFYFKTTCLILTLQVNIKYLFLPLVYCLGLSEALYVFVNAYKDRQRALFVCLDTNKCKTSECRH